MRTTLEVTGLAEIAALWARAPEVAEKHMRAAMEESLLLLQRETAEATPTAANQLLRKSIVAQPVEELPGGGLLGVVDVKASSGKYGSVLNYALAVELGTKPHMPPILPLIDWVKAKLGLKGEEAESAAHAIAWKIFHRGTEGAFMFRDTLAKFTPAVNARFDRALADIVAELGAT